MRHSLAEVLAVEARLSSSAKAASQPKEKIADGDTCKVSHGRGNIKGVCKHCGCRMQISQDDLAKLCTYCKCGVKMKECLYNPH